jgi:hypothetical protein
MLTRKQMLTVINGGETIVFKGQSYGRHNINELPSEADLAKGDAEKEAAAAENIKAQLAALQADLDKLEANKAKTAEPVKTEDDSKKETPKADAKSEAKSDSKK